MRRLGKTPWWAFNLAESGRAPDRVEGLVTTADFVGVSRRPGGGARLSIGWMWTARQYTRDNSVVSQPEAKPLPPEVRTLFWEYGDGTVSLEVDRELVVGRVLSAGTWEAVRWLRREVGDSFLRDYLSRTHGRLLAPRQLRLWQVLLDLPEDAVTLWIASAARQVWDRRAG